MLKITGLSKRYFTADGEVTALDEVSLTVEAGEFTAIVGKSGSGKTTLLNMIAGLDRPDHGSILFRGADIVKMSERKSAALRRREIGVIYQFYNLIPELTVAENITLPLELDERPVDGEWLSEILRTVGLNGRENAYPAALSGGQQQRAAIARAVIGRPSIILADEPTGNLDGENSAEVMKLLGTLNREQGITVLMVTHSNEAADAAGRVITVADGRILSDRRR